MTVAKDLVVGGLPAEVMPEQGAAPSGLARARRLRISGEQQFVSLSTLGLLIVFLVFVGLWMATKAFMHASSLVDHSHEAQKTMDTLMLGLVDAETAQRGFLLTRDEGYLTNYAEGKHKALSAADRLMVLVSDNASQTALLEQLHPLVMTGLGEIEKIIQLQQEDGIKAARERLRE